MTTHEENEQVLYCNEDCSVTLIDIPTSIAAAQFDETVPHPTMLLSCPPLVKPYTVAEPTSSWSKSKLNHNTIESKLHLKYKSAIEEALAEITSHHPGNWCLPRITTKNCKKKSADEVSLDGETPKKDDTETDASLQNSKAELTTSPDDSSDNGIARVLRALCETNKPSYARYLFTTTDFGTELKTDTSKLQHTTSTLRAWEGCFCNHEEQPLGLSLSTTTEPLQTYKFLIPPGACFLLGDCTDAASFHAALRNHSDARQSTRRFDFILLDPPWPNASARRKKAYTILSTVRDVKLLILRMDLDALISENGFLGIWTTNKPAIRTAVLGPGGLFERLNVGLLEEWIWVKTTCEGQVVSPLDSVWRKPYEVFLVAGAPSSRLEIAQPAAEVKYRVIAGVPDLHSRKPCLKYLIERLLLQSQEYRAVEVFARHLVKGWWSWGNEVLMFNSTECWATSTLSPLP